jgi:hypothetical protein
MCISIAMDRLFGELTERVLAEVFNGWEAKRWKHIKA